MNCPRCGRPLVYQWSAESALAGELVHVYDCTRHGAFHLTEGFRLGDGLPVNVLKDGG